MTKTNRIAIVFGIFAFLLVVGYAVLAAMVDVNGIKAKLAEAVKEATGLELVVLGNTSVYLIPPHINIRQVAVKNVVGGLNPYILTAETIHLYFPFSALFGGEKKVDTIILSTAQFIVEDMQNGTRNFDKLGLSKTLGEKGLPVKFQFINSSIKRATFNQPVVTLAQGISGSFFIGGHDLEMDLSGMYANKPFVLKWEPSGKDKDNVKLTVTDEDTSAFIYEGKLKLFPLSAEGRFAMDSKDLLPILGMLDAQALNATLPKPPPLPAGVPVSAQPQPVTPRPPLAVKLQGSIFYSPERFALTGVKVESDTVNGTLEINTKGNGKAWEGTGSTAITTGDMDKMQETGLLKFLSAVGSRTQGGSIITAEGTMGGGLFPYMDLEFQAKADSIIINKLPVEDIDIAMSISGGDIVVEQGMAKLPGNSEIDVVGLLKSGFQGVTFEGTVDSSGQDFILAAPLFNISTGIFPKEDFKRYHVKGNLVFSAQEARLTEMTAKIEQVSVIGALIFNFQDQFSLDAAVNITGLNIDHFLKDIPLSAVVPEFSNNTEKPKPSAFIQWLNSYRNVYRIKGALDQYIYNSIVRDKFEFSLELSKGKFDIHQLGARFNGTSMTGSVQINTLGLKPNVDVKLLCDVIDFYKFFDIAPPEAETKEPSAGNSDRWSKQEFHFQPLLLLNGKFDIGVGILIYGDTQLKDIAAIGTLQDGLLEINKLHANALGSDLNARFKLNVGKLASAALSFTLDNIATEQLNTILPLFGGMVGRFNMSGSISTSGINLYSWVSNALGSIEVAGRDIVVKGFNLPGIVHAVSAVRSTADIVNVVRLAFPGGDTQLDTVRGSFNMAQGVLNTPGVDIITLVAPGKLSGKINVLDWNMNNALVFSLSSLSVQKSPSLTLLISGSMDGPKLGLDTRSLEEYVAIKTREKLLQSVP